MWVMTLGLISSPTRLRTMCCKDVNKTSKLPLDMNAMPAGHKQWRYLIKVGLLDLSMPPIIELY